MAPPFRVRPCMMIVLVIVHSDLPRFVADGCKEGHSEASLINAEGVVSSSPTTICEDGDR